MRRFLRHMALFVLPVLAVAIVLEIVAESIPNSYTYKREYMELKGASVQTLILGSSNAYDDFCPAELPEAFNLANSSQTLEDDYRLLSRFIDDMDSLKTVIVGLGYHSLGSTSKDNRRMYYTIYMGLYPRWPISKYSFEVCNLELLTKKIIKYMVSRDVTRCDSLGQRVGHTAAAVRDKKEFWNKDVETLAANDRFDVQRSAGVIERNVHYLHAISDVCAAHDIRFIVVNMPVKAEYKECLPVEQLALQEVVLQDMSSSAIVIDASDWQIPADGWYNATHLTREAAVDFTRQIREEIVDRK